MKKAALVVIVLWLAVLLVVGFTDAKAQPTTYYNVGFYWARGYDQPTIDSAFVIFCDGSSGADDSCLRMPYDTTRYAGRQDTLGFMVHLNTTTISKSINPFLQMCIFPSNRRTLQPPYICDVQYVTHLIHAADSARAVNVSVSLDSAQLADLIDAIIAGIGGGTGTEPQRIYVLDTSQAPDALVHSARVQVRNNGLTVVMAIRSTLSSGFVDVMLDTASGANAYKMSADLPGFMFTDSAWYTLVKGTGQETDTIKAYTFNPVLPGSADSITLVFYLPGQEWQVKVAPLAQEEGQADTSGVLLLPYPLYGNPDINNVASVQVLRSNACDPVMPYQITVYRKSDKQQLLKINEYYTPDDSVAYVEW
jgi:hypothetical protein